MKIIIVGCGKVGYALTEQLNAEGHEITVIDMNGTKLHSVTDSLDVMGVEGNGAIYNVQMEAGIKEADLLIATTDSDELNMLCCLIAKKAADCHTIARIRNPEYTDEINFIREELNLSMAINPELEAAREIARVLKFPSAIKIDSFARGRIDLLKFAIHPGSVLHDMKVMEIYTKLHCSVLLAAIERGKDVFIPDGNFQLKAGDKISIVSTSADALDFIHKAGFENNPIKTAMFIGGGRTGFYLAKLLSDTKIKIKIIDRNLDRCNMLAEQLPDDVMVLYGNGADRQLLMEEGIAKVDAFAALTNFDEENIMLSLYAGSLSDVKLITKVNKVSFEEVVQNLNLGSVIEPKKLTAQQISRYVRAMQNSMGSNVESLVRIAGGKLEALEFRVEKDSPVIGIPLEKLATIDNLIVACINRGGVIITPRGKDTIEAGDTVIVVTSHTGLNDLKDILR